MATDPEMFKTLQSDKEVLRVRIENNKGLVMKEDAAKFEAISLDLQPELSNPVFLDDIDRQMRLGKPVPAATIRP